MTQAAVVIAATGVGTVAMKSLGPVVLGGRTLPPRVLSVLAMLAPTLLAALVVTNAFAHGHHLVLDPRAAGLGVAAVAIALRAPLLVVIVVAAATAALLRLVT